MLEQTLPTSAASKEALYYHAVAALEPVVNELYTRSAGEAEIERQAERYKALSPLARIAMRHIIVSPVISPQNLPDDDPRRLSNTCYSAQPEFTAKTLRFYKKAIGNFQELTDTLGQYWSDHELDRAPGAVIMTPHITGLSDLAIATALSVNRPTERASISRASNNYMLLGRLIAFSEIKIIGSGKIIRPFDMLRSTSNLAQVIPDTESTAEIRQSYNGLIDTVNRPAGREMISWLKRDHPLLCITPGGRRCQETERGIEVPRIPDSMIGYLSSAQKKGFPLVICGVPASEQKLFFAQTPYFGTLFRQKLQLELAQPIREIRDQTELRKQVQTSTIAVIEAATGKPAYFLP